MELIRTSVICCALARAWGALAAAWRSSALCRGLTAFFDDILLRWASGSVICRWFSKDGWMGPAWRTSLFGRLVTWVANLIPSILHWIYRRAKGLFDGSLFCRLTYAIGDQTAVLTSWVVLAILVVPHDLWNNLYGVILAFLLLAVFYWAGMRRADWQVRTGAMGGTFWLYALTVALAVVLSNSKMESLRYFLFHVMALLLAVVIVSSVTKKAELLRLMAFAAVGVVVSSLYGFWQKIQGIDVNLSTVDLSASPDTPGRVDSFFNNPNTFAQILVLLLPLCCALFLCSRRWWTKALAGLTVLVGVGALLTTYSRASWVGMAAAILLFCFLVNRKSIFFLILLALAAVPFLPESVLNRILSIFSGSDESIGSRFPIYRAGLQLFQDHWLMGVGLGDEITTAALDGTNYYNFSSGFRFVHYHNTFLQIMVERGLVGLLTFLSTLIWGAKEGLKRTFGRKDLRYPVCGAIAGLVGMLVCGMGDYIWYYPRAMMLFWFVFGVLVAAARLAKQEADLIPAEKEPTP